MGFFMRIDYIKGTRYYSLRLEHDLFDWVVQKRFGNIMAKRGHEQNKPFSSRDEALNYFIGEHKRRLKRKYQIC
ncbi:hypothetical protein CR151_17115 [Vibrio cholerae]|nr:hypothetical protein CR151_17115 [Vibrio cholerae]